MEYNNIINLVNAINTKQYDDEIKKYQNEIQELVEKKLKASESEKKSIEKEINGKKANIHKLDLQRGKIEENKKNIENQISKLQELIKVYVLLEQLKMALQKAKIRKTTLSQDYGNLYNSLIEKSIRPISKEIAKTKENLSSILTTTSNWKQRVPDFLGIPSSRILYTEVSSKVNYNGKEIIRNKSVPISQLIAENGECLATAVDYFENGYKKNLVSLGVDIGKIGKLSRLRSEELTYNSLTNEGIEALRIKEFLLEENRYAEFQNLWLKCKEVIDLSNEILSLSEVIESFKGTAIVNSEAFIGLVKINYQQKEKLKTIVEQMRKLNQEMNSKIEKQEGKDYNKDKQVEEESKVTEELQPEKIGEKGTKKISSDDLKSLSSGYRAAYIREKMNKTELGRLDYSEYLRIKYPEQVELIEYVYNEERKTRGMHGAYIRDLFQRRENNKPAISFRKYVEINYRNINYNDLEIPLDVEKEEIKAGRRI